MTTPHARWAGKSSDWVRVQDTTSEHPQFTGSSADVWIRRPVRPKQPHHVVWLRAFPTSIGIEVSLTAPGTLTAARPTLIYLADGNGRLREMRPRVSVAVDPTGGGVTVWLGPPDNAKTPCIRGRLSADQLTQLELSPSSA